MVVGAREVYLYVRRVEAIPTSEFHQVPPLRVCEEPDRRVAVSAGKYRMLRLNLDHMSSFSVANIIPTEGEAVMAQKDRSTAQPWPIGQDRRRGPALSSGI